MKKIKELIKSSFDKGVELDKKILEKIEKKFNLSPQTNPDAAPQASVPPMTPSAPIQF